MNKKVKKITLYATLSCPYCKMEDAWLTKKGIQHNLVFVDLSPHDAKAIVEKTGQMGVPVTEVLYDDARTEFVIGFDEQKLTHVLGV